MSSSLRTPCGNVDGARVAVARDLEQLDRGVGLGARSRRVQRRERSPASCPARRAIAAAAHMFSNTVSGREDLRHLERARDAEPGDLARRQAGDVAALEADRPLLGQRWPVIMLTKVVLPAPLAPMMPTVCCGRHVDARCRARRPPSRRFSPGRARRGSASVMRSVSRCAAAANSEPGPRAGTGW